MPGINQPYHGCFLTVEDVMEEQNFRIHNTIWTVHKIVRYYIYSPPDAVDQWVDIRIIHTWTTSADIYY